MTDDLVTRLRGWNGPYYADAKKALTEAADEIELLRDLVGAQDQMIQAQHERILILDPEFAAYYEQPLKIELDPILDVCE